MLARSTNRRADLWRPTCPRPRGRPRSRGRARAAQCCRLAGPASRCRTSRQRRKPCHACPRAPARSAGP
eukprot:4312964-Lingulodinium_polyedra.AAC.1